MISSPADLPPSLAGLRIPVNVIGLSATKAVLGTTNFEPSTSAMKACIVKMPVPPLTPESAYVCEPLTWKVPAGPGTTVPVVAEVCTVAPVDRGREVAA